jgi:hypothetical protein
MSDVETVASTAPTALPKSTTPDELLSMYDEEVKSSAESLSDQAEVELKVKEEIPKVEAAKKLAEAAKDLPKPEPKEVPDEEPDTRKPVIEEKPKALKAKFGTEEIEVPEEAEFVQKINGKDVSFKTKDAIRAYVTQEEFNRKMDQRVGHVSAREKRWEHDQASFKDKIGKVLEVTRSGDFVTGIRALAKLATVNTDLDPVEFEKAYFNQLDKVGEVYSKMTPEQRDKYFADRKAQTLEEANKRLLEEQQKQTELAQLKATVSELQQKNGIGDDEFGEHFRLMAQHKVGEGKEFANVDDIKPQDVVRYVKAYRNEVKVQEAAEKLKIDDQNLLAEVSKLTSTHPEFDVEDVVAIIERSGVTKQAAPSVVENLNRKAEKSNLKSQPKEASSTKKEKQTGYDKEEEDFLYRQAPKGYRTLYR